MNNTSGELEIELDAQVGAVTDGNKSTDVVFEDDAIGAVVGITVSAIDKDTNDTVRYTLSDSADGRFAIDSVTGVVTVADPSKLDASVNSSHNITVLATSENVSSGTSTTSSKTFSISILKDMPVGPVTDINTGANQVSESAARNTLVGITASATDPDSWDTVSYALENDYNGAFKIDASTGVVSIANSSSLNFEQTATYQVTVVATSTDGTSSKEVFTLNLLDAQETISSIKDINSLVSLVPENAVFGTEVGIQAFASDEDAGDKVSYSLTNNANGLFAIHDTTGVVTVSNPSLLDYETATGHYIQIKATSTDGSASYMNAEILVQDVNEYSVAYSVDKDNSANGMRSTSAGSKVGITVYGKDDDGRDNLMEYSLLNTAKGKFTIDKYTGVITVAEGANFASIAPFYVVESRALSADGSYQDKMHFISTLSSTRPKSGIPGVLKGAGGSVLQGGTETTYLNFLLTRHGDLDIEQ